MNALKLLNLLVRFLLELSMLVAVGYWGFKTQSAWGMNILLGIGFPILIAILWGLFVAPKAVHPLHGASHLTLELILLFSGTAALFVSGKPSLAWVYTIILVINRILIFVWKQ